MVISPTFEGHPHAALTAREYMAREWPGALALMAAPEAPGAFAEDEAKAAAIAAQWGINPIGEGLYPAWVWALAMQ